MTKTEVISQRILDKMVSVASANAIALNDRLAVQSAIDFVLGPGAFDQLVSDLYDDLRAKAA